MSRRKSGNGWDMSGEQTKTSTHLLPLTGLRRIRERPWGTWRITVEAEQREAALPGLKWNGQQRTGKKRDGLLASYAPKEVMDDEYNSAHSASGYWHYKKNTLKHGIASNNVILYRVSWGQQGCRSNIMQEVKMRQNQASYNNHDTASHDTLDNTTENITNIQTNANKNKIQAFFNSLWFDTTSADKFINADEFAIVNDTLKDDDIMDMVNKETPSFLEDFERFKATVTNNDQCRMFKGSWNIKSILASKSWHLQNWWYWQELVQGIPLTPKVSKLLIYV